jgi:HK97 gp10 family phage protein
MPGDIEKLKRRMDAIPAAVREAVKPALEQSGQELVEAMQHLAPVDTGALQRSIVMTKGGAATPPYSQPGGSHIVPDNAVAITAGNTEVRYAHLEEYGTTRAPAQPFFWPSYRLFKNRIAQRTKRAISKAVRERWVR